MNETLKKYLPLLDFFSAVLGSTAEIVLHDITTTQGLGASIVYIQNNVSGRKLGAPATDFLMNILSNGIYKEKEFLANYRSKDVNGKEFLSSSYFIKNEQGQLIGMICININQSQILELGVKIEETLNLFSDLTNYKTKMVKEPEPVINENLYKKITNIVDEAVFEVVGKKNVQVKRLSRSQKLDIVRVLYNKSYFDFKNAVVELANVFEMAEVSIYKYVQEVRNE